MRTLLRLFSPLAVLALAAPAQAEVPEPLQGVWLGRPDASARATVTLHVDKERLVLVEAAEVAIGPASFRIAGPGTKDGKLMYAIDWQLSGRFGADGKPAVKGRRGSATRLGSMLVDDGSARLCFAETADPALRPRFVALAADPKVPTRCFDLSRVADPAPGPMRDTPRFGPPDGSAPNPPVELAPKPGAHECMSECRQQHQARAVSADQIDRDCAKLCGLETH